MMRKSVANILLVGLLSATSVASAQDDPADPQYYRRWLRDQVESWKRVESVSFHETTRRTLDGPTGSQQARFTAEVTVYPGDRDLERTITAAELNGRRVSGARLQEFAGRWSRFTSDLGQESTAFGDFRLRVLERTRPTGRPELERRDGRDIYRVDLISTAPRLPIDRITLWFDASDGSLVRSRTIFRPQAQRTTLISENGYRRIGSLDVPVQRRVEATVQRKRRLRHFTTIVTVDSQFESFRIEQVR